MTGDRGGDGGGHGGLLELAAINYGSPDTSVGGLLI